MPALALLFGLILSALGAVGFLKPDLLGTVGEEKSSITGLIPAFFGVALILCGLISMGSPNLRKHAMHISAMIALLGLIGALVRPIMVLIDGGQLDFAAALVRAQALMAVLSLIYLILCIRSFIAARRARQANPPIMG